MEDDDGDSSGSARKKRDMGKKRKRPPELRDPNSPKRATSAYVFFCHEMRRKIRSGEIKKAATISRTISDAWANLTSSEKQVYRDLAAEDYQRFKQEFSVYRQTDQYTEFIKLQKAELLQSDREPKQSPKKQNAGRTATSRGKSKTAAHEPEEPMEAAAAAIPSSSSRPPPVSLQQGYVTGTEVPIFTQQFLQHNKEMESELRKLRLSTADLEEENALLSRHVENMSAAVTKYQAEVEEQSVRNASLRLHLRALRAELVEALGDLEEVGGSIERPTVDTVDTFIGVLVERVEAGRDGGEVVELVRRVVRGLEARVRERVRSMEEQGQLL